VLFTMASVVCGAASSLTMLIIARCVQGAGGGALQPISQAVLLESFPPARRGVAMAVFGLGVVVAPIVGPTLGGWITDNYSWRWIFYINLPIGALAIFLCMRFLEDPPWIRRAKESTIDYIGFSLLLLWIATLQIILDKGQQEDWFASTLIRSLAVVAVPALVGFIAWELWVDHPIVNLRVLKNRNFLIGTILMTAMGMVLYGSTALLPLFLQTLMGYPALQSGLTVSPRGFGSIAAMLMVGRMIGRIDSRYLMMFGFALLGISTYRLSVLNLDIAWTNVMWPNIFNGLAMGFIFVPLSTTSMGTLPNEQIGGAAGIFNLMRNLGGGVGISAATTLLARHAQMHQVTLVQHINPYNPAYQHHVSMLSHVLGPLGGTFPPRALGVLYAQVLQQANLLSFMDDFRMMGVLSLICVPGVMFFSRVRARGSAAAAAAH
jgi:DHA2 family multidrug resistance protein